MKFGEALEALKEGHRIARAGWNGKSQFVTTLKMPVPIDIDGAGFIPLEPLMVLKNSQNKLNSWVPSSSDCWAEDWEIVPMEWELKK